jgi:acyl-CoA thioester hydrolase
VPSIAELEALPLFHRAVISPDYLDQMGHMNVQWYMAIYDRAVWRFFAWLGMDEAYYHREKAGAFALQQFIQYLAEVHTGETVAVRSRVVGLSAKRIHAIHFMINETTNVLASTIEVLGSHADLVARRTSPFPPHIAARIASKLDGHTRLDWDAPLCGVIQA